MKISDMRLRMRSSRERFSRLRAAGRYLALTVIGFTFLYPLLQVISTSIMSPDDLANPHVGWIPSMITLQNYSNAMMTLDFGATFARTMLLVCVCTLLQTASCSLAGYAFARFDFPGKRLWMSLLLVSYMLPFQITMIPLFVQFNSWHMLGSAWAFFVPAALGQGIQSALCVLVFYQFYSQLHQSLVDAARIDGAGEIATYWKVALPLSGAAVIVTVVFSVVWYWNETDLASLYQGFGQQADGSVLTTLMLKLEQFTNTYQKAFDQSGASIDPLNDGILNAGIVLAMAPLILFYLLFQRYFLESAESSGITGE